jgi:ATP-dependent helicase HrpB
MTHALEPLPMDAWLPAIVAALKSSPGLVLCAPPGAGKTTRVPRALYDAGFAQSGDILILEPRRIAARLAAARVAGEFGQNPGATVGYSIRHENVGGPDTRIRFLTEGILARRIVRDPLLDGVSTVILDEFHERHLTTDLALAFLRRLQKGARPDLRLIVMSATLDADPIAGFLGGAPVVASTGSRFEVGITHEERESAQPLHQKVALAAAKLLKEGIQGDILIFLPGAQEIRLAAEALQPLAAKHGLLVLPLHGDLPMAAQARALQPADRRKLVLATNVAESSITVPGIAAVIDSGLARIAGHSAWSGLPVLSLSRISRSSALQRAGRAGRTQNGRVMRLYTQHDFETRPEHEVPEIRRSDLAETLLILYGAGVSDLHSFPWFEPPSATAIAAAQELLALLDALRNGSLTATGRRMLRFPLHPRLARLVVEGERRGCGPDSCLVAALISERDIRLQERSDPGLARRAKPVRASAPSDVLELLDCFRSAAQAQFDPARLGALGLDVRAVSAVERARVQLVRLVAGTTERPAPQDHDEALMIAVLAAFPDRLAKRRSAGSREFLLAAGGTAGLTESSVAHLPDLIVAVDAGERTGAKGSRDSSAKNIRLASAVEPEWLAELFPDNIRQSSALEWNEQAGRVEEVRRTLYGELALETVSRPAPPSEAAALMLLGTARVRGWTVFGDADRTEALRARMELAARHFPAAGLKPLDDAGMAAACAACCAGKRSLAELAGSSIVDAVLDSLTPKQKDILRKETPERIALPNGRKVAVHYEAGKMPWIESALQDFFGMKSTPAICAGRVPLTVHLLAPNRRPVQVTQDLPGFWKRHYPELRRQLQRRYPKHPWPEPPV